MRRSIALVIGVSLAMTSLACGDKLSAIAGGVRFERIYSARHPGRIVIYAPVQSQLRVANEELKLADVLRRAGHTVEVISELQGLQRAMQLDTADLLLMDVADTELVAGRDTGIVAKATVLPVSYAPSAKTTATASSQAKCITRLTKRSNPLLLRLVDDSLDRQSRGLPATCEAATQPRNSNT
jgi:hypothetical protein